MNKTKATIIITALVISTGILGANSVMAEEGKIPPWVKGVFAFYAQGNMSDLELIDALKFLIENEILVIDNYGKIDILLEEEEPMKFTASTDKTSYVRGDDIIISGTIPQLKGGELLLMIRYADMAFIEMHDVYAQDGQYEKTISTTDRDDFESKEFTIEVRYNNEKIFTNFQYSK